MNRSIFLGASLLTLFSLACAQSPSRKDRRLASAGNTPVCADLDANYKIYSQMTDTRSADTDNKRADLAMFILEPAFRDCLLTKGFIKNAVWEDRSLRPKWTQTCKDVLTSIETEAKKKAAETGAKKPKDPGTDKAETEIHDGLAEDADERDEDDHASAPLTFPGEPGDRGELGKKEDNRQQKFEPSVELPELYEIVREQCVDQFLLNKEYPNPPPPTPEQSEYETGI